ncbi:Serine/threonine-protein kinase BRI 2 [Spatholobus suberectus]|nr:Serine/threonine-protein kinase BRI 2 [Spatholobus suberectus]
MVSFMEDTFYLRGKVKIVANGKELDLQCSNFYPVLGTEDLNDQKAWNGWEFFNNSTPLEEGDIPKCIGSLGQLIELKLAWNRFVGSIPHTLANLSNLQNLDLRYNNLVTNDLEWLSHLSDLRYLGLSNINLSRAIDWPSSISKIPYLLELYLDDCGLPQVNHEFILHVNSSTSLQILGLSGNKLDFSIMSWVLNVSKVLTLPNLANNSLHCVPDGFTLSLQNTNIVGPLSFGHLPHLEYLDLSLNHLNGSLPIFEVTKFASLQVLQLSHNQLSGPLPYTLGQLSNLTELFLTSNKLKGIISEAHLLSLFRLEILDGHFQIVGRNFKV